MVLHEDSIAVLVIGDDLGEPFRLEVLSSLLCILGLHNNHIPSIAALVKQATCCCTILER